MPIISLLETIGLTVVKEAGNEIICTCPDCGKNKLSVNKQTAQWQCWVGCDKGNAWTLLGKQTAKSKSEIAQILQDYNLIDPPRHFSKPHTNRLDKKPMLAADDVVTVSQTEIDQFSRAKKIDPVVFGHLQAYKLKDSDIIIIPGFDPDKPKKACGWIRVHTNGKYIKTASGLQKYPVIVGSQPGLIGYKTLPQSDTILFCEGWKDFLAARSQGYASLTNTQGVKTWRNSWGQVFIDKTVLIIFDRDKAGQSAERLIAGHISEYARQVKIARLPHQYKETGGKDLHDYVRGDAGKIEDLEFVEFVPITDNSAKTGHGTTCRPVNQKSAELLSAETERKEKTKLFVADFSKYLDFPVDAMPEVLRPFIETASEAIQCPPDFIGVPLLTALGGVIGRTHMIEVKAGWRESTALWTVVVGETGTAKSPALKVALKPLYEVQEKAFEEYSLEMDIYTVDAKKYKKKYKFWVNDKEDTKPPEDPKEPILQRIIVSDATVEALTPIMHDNPRGLILSRDELAGWINSMNQYKGGKGADIQFFLTVWSGGNVIVDRKNLSETINISDTYLAITGSCQPGVLMDLLDEERQQDGFASRLLISYPRGIQRQWTDSGIEESVKQPVAQLFIKLYKLEMLEYNDEYSPALVTFTPKGLEVFKEVMNVHFAQKNKYQLSGPILAHWAKMEGYIARMALIIHVIRKVENETDKEMVDETSVLMAAGLGDYFLAHAARLYGMIDESKSLSCCERTLRWARKHQKMEIAPRDLISARIVNNAEESRALLDDLEAAGKGYWADDGKKKFIFRPMKQLSNSADFTIQGEK